MSTKRQRNLGQNKIDVWDLILNGNKSQKFSSEAVFLWIFSVRFLIGGKLYQFREKRAGSTPWASENTHLLNQLSIKGKWCFLSKVNGNVFLMKNVRSSFKNSLCKVFSVENKLHMSYFQNTCSKLVFKGSNFVEFCI